MTHVFCQVSHPYPWEKPFFAVSTLSFCIGCALAASARAQDAAMQPTVEVTASRYMPPWQPAHNVGVFAGERRLSDDEIALIHR